MASERKPRSSDDLVDWFTITYKTIYTAIAIVVAIAGGTAYYYYSRNAPPPPPPTDAPVAAQATAHFTAIEGTVKVKAVGTFEWVSADASTPLRKSDLVRTGPGSAAEIRFCDGTNVAVRADSLINIEETSCNAATKKHRVAFAISGGEVRYQVAKPGAGGGTTEISTPTVRTVAVDEGAGAILVKDDGQSDVKVFQGRLEATTKSGDTVELDANEAVSVDAGGKAGPEMRLPAAPVLVSPPHQAELSYANPTRETTLLAWKSVPGTTLYHVQLDYSPYFNKPLVDSTVRDNSVELRGLELGKYWWRVAAQDAAKVEGNFSEYARFTVGKPSGPVGGDGPPPPLTIETMDVRTNILQIKGRTEPGATLTVNGQRVDVQADGTFNEFIQLVKPGRQLVVVKAVGINGGVNEQRRPIVVAD